MQRKTDSKGLMLETLFPKALCGTNLRGTDRIISQLIEMGRSLGYVVRPGVRNCCSYGLKEITYNGKQKPLRKIFSLAHEIGHAVTHSECESTWGGKAIYGHSDYVPTRWYILESELKAWEFAEYLGRKMGFLGPKMMKYKHACLRTYYRFLT